MAKDGVATKTDLKRLERTIKADIIKRLDSDINRLEKNIQSQILNSEVKVLGELQKMREDNAAHQFSHSRINDDLQDHEKRIKHLETAKI